ncbi:MAG: hypothetical protein WBM32_16070, partial [Crocosphaera sp.]
MKTVSSHGQYLQISDCYQIPSYLRDVLDDAWQNSYEELYEESRNQKKSLEETFINILNAFDQNNLENLHYRYLFMAIIMAQAVEPTIKAYFPDDTRPEKVYQYVDEFLNNKTILSNLEITKIINQLFPCHSEGCQAIDEALNVFKNLLRVIDFEQAKEALLNILDDCLEGYAIFPGSQGKRDLFNWWLLEVVPATWCLKFPKTLYT